MLFAARLNYEASAHRAAGEFIGCTAAERLGDGLPPSPHLLHATQLRWTQCSLLAMFFRHVDAAPPAQAHGRGVRRETSLELIRRYCLSLVIECVDHP
jgi:hypothetical protein